MPEQPSNRSHSDDRRPFEELPWPVTPGAPVHTDAQAAEAVKFGAFFSIPNEHTGLPQPGTHPWVVVEPHGAGRPMVVVSLCSSSDSGGPDRLAMPAGVLPDLDRPGMIILGVTQRLHFRDLARYRYLGRLPLEWLRKLRAALDARARRIAALAEEDWR